MKRFTSNSTIRDVVAGEIEKGFLDALRETIACARHNPNNVAVRGVGQFNSDILPLLRVIDDQSESGIPKELEPPWLAEIDAILTRVASDLAPSETSPFAEPDE